MISRIACLPIIYIILSKLIKEKVGQIKIYNLIKSL